MNLVLTMAGKYERFRLFGNKVPKYLMPLGKATVLWHVIDEIIRSQRDLNIYLLANDSDRDFQPVIAAVMDDFSINKDNLAFINDTRSQLETAVSISDKFQGKFVGDRSPLAFANIDTIVKSRRGFFDTLAVIEENQGLIDTFIGSSHEYSYILAADNGEIRTVYDGSRVSDNACSGLYGFGSADFFCTEATKFLEEHEGGNFTSFYQTLISQGSTVFPNNNSDARDTLVLGTPEEYISNVHRF